MKSIRLAGYDYSRSGAYFVTICARDRRCLFGTIQDGQLRDTELGRIVASCWHEIPLHLPNTVLDAFVIMPDHIHGIIVLTDVPEAGHARPLPVIVGSFKSAVSRLNGTPVWQRSYWERILRNEDELNRARRYIEENPIRWESADQYDGVHYRCQVAV